VTRPGWWSWRRGDSAAEAEALLAQGARPRAPTAPRQRPCAARLTHRRATARAAPPPEREPEPLDAYVLVEREDVVEALAFFIARFVASHPDATALPPAKLQRALCGALADVRRSRARRLWDWSRNVHRWGVWCYGAFSCYENPWLIKALAVAFWTAGRVAVGLVC
jgi:hypothetical protein